MQRGVVLYVSRIAAVATLLALAAVPVLGQEIIELGHPVPGDTEATYTMLQGAIDANPGAVLMLQEGDYDIGDNHLMITHGVTLEGVAADGAAPLTTIRSGSQYAGIFVAAVGEHAQDEIYLRNLRIEVTDYRVWFGAVLHVPYVFSDVPFGAWGTGGGNLSIEECWIWSEWFGVRSLRSDDVSIRIIDSRIESWQDAVRIENSSFDFLEVANNDIVSGNSGVEIINFPGAGITRAGRAHIKGNTIRAGLFASAYGFEAIRVAGPVIVKGNTFDVHSGHGILWDTAPGNTKSGQVVGNIFIGGDTDDGQARLGVLYASVFPPYTTGAKKVQFRDNTFTGSWTIGVAVDDYSENNLFIDTDFSAATVVAAENPFGGTFPGVHWSFGGLFVQSNQKNSVTDNSGVDQLVINQGTGNHFQGTSFLPTQAVGPHNRPDFLPAGEEGNFPDGR